MLEQRKINFQPLKPTKDLATSNPLLYKAVETCKGLAVVNLSLQGHKSQKRGWQLSTFQVIVGPSNLNNSIFTLVVHFGFKIYYNYGYYIILF
jgi:hypothetical protein